MKKKVALSAISAALILTLSGCGESTSSTTGEQYGQPQTPVNTTFDQTALLVSLVDNAIIPTYKDFLSKAQQLQTSVDTYCAAIGTDTEASSRDDVHQAWRGSMSVWQLAEMMQLGPLSENNNALRNRIYSWPNVSTCAVDQDVVLADTDASYAISDRTATRKGLDALEYTLFSDDLNHTCTAFGTAPEGWNNRTEEARKTARCSYSQLAVDDLIANAETLIAEWEGDNGFGARLKNAGLPDSEYRVALEAVNDVSDSMFYLTEVTKDAKLATPIGILANDCGLSPCPQNVESQYAHHSLQNIIANLKAMRLLFTGGVAAEGETTTGFNDFLVDVGDEETATRMLADLDAAIQFAESLDGSFASIVEDQTEQAETLHNRVKDVTDTLKTDFIQSLALELPATSAGDND
ncbi:imelysin family protein [Alteromonas sp. ASW11-19]|uniref:Imelysin family protein n=1 Tax=Alteromonas salexigens TaxID=2982530 RepID=A0ABT2VPX5_9ALTE|nr:imelysin family protein [Alteromonas salexigens]MCU7555361.1 imelysin family protein [Alteromonas salexigens]